MEKILLGFLLGFISPFLLRMVIVRLREKRGLHQAEFEPRRLSQKVRLILREVVFKFSVKRFNRDFGVNVKTNGRGVVMQFLHRAHFPELNKNIDDVKFGIAVYIPIAPLEYLGRDKLIGILKEEAQPYEIVHVPFEYVVIDIGISVKIAGYLIARIIKEVYKEDDCSFELADEGNLPYHFPSSMFKEGK